MRPSSRRTAANTEGDKNIENKAKDTSHAAIADQIDGATQSEATGSSAEAVKNQNTEVRDGSAEVRDEGVERSVECGEDDDENGDEDDERMNLAPPWEISQEEVTVSRL